MEDLISKRKLLNDLAGMYDVLTGAGDPFLACMIKRAMECVERQPIVVLNKDVPESDTIVTDKALAKAIRELKEAYARAQGLEYVYNKLGWALHHVWRKHE